jgi:hypothetical protein
MPITLPNTGLICPEQGDPNAQACQQLKELFIYIDTLPSADDQLENPCVNLIATNWVLEVTDDLDASCRQFKQTITVPTGVNPFKSNMTIIDDDSCITNLEIEVQTVSTLCVRTNDPGNYQVIFS